MNTADLVNSSSAAGSRPATVSAQPPVAGSRRDLFGEPSAGLGLIDCFYVGGGYWRPAVGAPAVATLVFAVVSAAAWRVAVLFAIVSLACAALSFILLMAALYQSRRERRWIGLFDDGFVIDDARGTRQFLDEQVIAMAVDDEPQYAAGEVKSISRTVRLRLHGESEIDELKLQDRLEAGVPDRLAAWINRLQNSLFRRASHAVRQKLPVAGPGWLLERDELRVGEPPQDQTVHLDEMAAVDLVDKEVCIWRRGAESPAIRLPGDEWNAWLLERLLRDAIALPRQPIEESLPGLGRVVFRRGHSRTSTMACLASGLACLLAGILVALSAWLLIGIALVLTGGALCLLGAFAARAGFRSHEFGIAKVGLFGKLELRDDDIASVTYSATPMYINSVYAGTSYTLSASPREESGKQTIAYRALLFHADEELERLRDRLAAAVAERMSREFALGHVVKWTAHLRLRQDGIEHYPKRLLFRSQQPVFVPFNSLSLFGVYEGRFCAWTNEQERAVINEDTSQPNFFAGLILLEDLLCREADRFPAMQR